MTQPCHVHTLAGETVAGGRLRTTSAGEEEYMASRRSLLLAFVGGVVVSFTVAALAKLIWPDSDVWRLALPGCALVAVHVGGDWLYRWRNDDSDDVDPP